MLEPLAQSSSTVPGASRDIPRSAGRGAVSAAAEGDDFFSSLGSEHKRKGLAELKPEPVVPAAHDRELNKQFKEGKALDDYEAPVEKKTLPGGPGYQWRMMKLRRLHEQAEEQ